MTVLFSDGFETNDFSGWTGTSTSGVGSTATVTTGAAQAGTYGFRALKPTSGNSGYAQCYKTGITGSGGKVYLEFQLRLAAITNNGVGGIAYVHNGTDNIIEFYVTADTSTFEAQFRKKDGTMTAAMSVGTLSTSTWYKIGLWGDWSLGTPEFKVFLDGSQVGSTVTDASSGSVSTTTLRLDIGGIEWSWSFTIDGYIDVVSMEDAIPAAGSQPWQVRPQYYAGARRGFGGQLGVR